MYQKYSVDMVNVVNYYCSCLEGQHPGFVSSLLTLRLVFCGYYLMKLPVEDLWGRLSRASNVLVLLLSCAPGPPSPLSILVRASLRCSVTGAVHSVVRDLQFLGNFSCGIAFICQNKNRLTSFRRKLFVSGHFEPGIEPTNSDTPDTQLV
jgi:hypothetical protein